MSVVDILLSMRDPIFQAKARAYSEAKEHYEKVFSKMLSDYLPEKIEEISKELALGLPKIEVIARAMPFSETPSPEMGFNYERIKPLYFSIKIKGKE